MATVAADIQENWIQDFANRINSKTVSVYEAVAITGLSHTTVRKRIRQKRIRAVRIAGNWRVVRADLAGLQWPSIREPRKLMSPRAKFSASSTARRS